MTWPATQVSPRRVKAGLGGHEDGVFGVDDGFEKTSLPLGKRRRTVLLESVTSSVFMGIESDFAGEIRNDLNNSHQQPLLHLILAGVFIH